MKNRQDKKVIIRRVAGKRAVLFVAAAIVFAVVTMLTFSIGVIDAFGKGKRELPIYRVDTDEKKIAISFDCAWGVDYTDKLLSIMGKRGIKCTFFAVEFWVKKYPDFVRKIHAAGHEIGTHSATHPHMSKLSETLIEKELTTSSRAIEEITGETPRVFRPPYGEYNDLLLTVAKRLNLYTIQWDVDSLDWKDLSEREIINRVVPRVKNGSIVLFHNNGLHTADALDEIIATLKGQGYEFVKIGDLIYRENYKIAADGSQIKTDRNSKG